MKCPGKVPLASLIRLSAVESSAVPVELRPALLKAGGRANHPGKESAARTESSKTQPCA